MSGEGEGRIEGVAEKLQIVRLRDINAVDCDRREAAVFLVPRGEQGSS